MKNCVIEPQYDAVKNGYNQLSEGVQYVAMIVLCCVFKDAEKFVVEKEHSGQFQ